jgi:NAD(P)-dependent dehydrogenase (short-subunit alcohol dehydrogenase family)
VSRALVTGANKGIGLGLCHELAADGWEVIATCRRASPELDALGVEVVEGVDVTEPRSADRIRDAVGGGTVDLVGVNAGTNLSFDLDRIDDLDLGLVEEELRINTLGAARTTLAVLPNLTAGSKVMFVSSGVVAPARQGSGNLGYAVSKTALNAFGRGLAHEVRDRGIVVVIVTPGQTDTDTLRRVNDSGRSLPAPGSVPRDPFDSARNLLGIAERATLESSGTFWGPDGNVIFTPDGIPL